MSTYKINFTAASTVISAGGHDLKPALRITPRASLKPLLTPMLAALMVTMFGGCSLFGRISENKSIDYRSQSGSKPASSLEVPPDLTSPIADDRYVIPDAKATTFSTYNRERNAAPAQGTGTSSVLTKVDNARIERAGQQRWLVVKTSSDKAWATAKSFWTEAGFVLNRESPEVGIMETDWAENRGKIPQDLVRRTIGRVIDGLYSSNERDKFRTRLEPGAEAGTIDIYVTHRGLQEAFTNQDQSSTSWLPRPNDSELEAEMLSRLMLKFGYAATAEKDKTIAAAAATTTAGNASASTAATAAPARASYDKEKGGSLKVNEPFDRAWRRVGLALDNTGFTVEDRDRSKGLFFVRYIDPDAEAKSTNGKGFLDKLAFWRKDDPASKPQYRLLVSEVAGISEVVVQTPDGKTDNSATAKRILSLLLDQLK